jgi:hypothetical protein
VKIEAKCAALDTGALLGNACHGDRSIKGDRAWDAQVTAIYVAKALGPRNVFGPDIPVPPKQESGCVPPAKKP